MLILPVSSKNADKKVAYGCIALILINVVIFFFFQSGDTAIRLEAEKYYEQSGLLALETEAYKTFLMDQGESISAQVDDNQQPSHELVRRMFADEAFGDMLEKNRIITPSQEQYEEWRLKRNNYEGLKNKAITVKYGYSPRHQNLEGLFSYMFLHGGIMHLVGNMVFLWLVGSFLEAAVSTSLFFILYTISGICAGALFGLVYPLSAGPLIGASGAIAGLMGAYGVVFALRKVRVFYSLGFYFNYANIPALTLFPVWLGNEFFQLYFNQDSHVAYMAHIGGLLSGILIGAGFRLWKKDRIEALFHKEQKMNRVDALLESGMEKLAHLDLKKAREDFKKILTIEPENMTAIRQLFLIDKSTPQAETFHHSARHLLQRLQSVDTVEYLAVFEEYRQATDKPKVTLEMLEQLSHLYLTNGSVSKAQACISNLMKRAPENSKLPVFLFALANRYSKSNNQEAAVKCLRFLTKRYPASSEASQATALLRRGDSVANADHLRQEK